jgi:hypothetical protein
MAAVALFGAGRIGAIHAANVAAHPGLSLKYVVDPVAEAAARIAEAHGVQVVTPEAALADPEVAGVIVPAPQIGTWTSAWPPPRPARRSSARSRSTSTWPAPEPPVRRWPGRG